jgi:hypothetical protein
MIQIVIPDSLLGFIEGIVYVSAIGGGVLGAYQLLKKEGIFNDLLMGDWDDNIV